MYRQPTKFKRSLSLRQQTQSESFSFFFSSCLSTIKRKRGRTLSGGSRSRKRRRVCACVETMVSRLVLVVVVSTRVERHFGGSVIGLLPPKARNWSSDSTAVDSPAHLL